MQYLTTRSTLNTHSRKDAPAASLHAAPLRHVMPPRTSPPMPHACRTTPMPAHPRLRLPPPTAPETGPLRSLAPAVAATQRARLRTAAASASLHMSAMALLEDRCGRKGGRAGGLRARASHLCCGTGDVK